MSVNTFYARLDSRAEENVLNRGQELLLIPASLIACAIDTIVALSTCGIVVICAIAGKRKVADFSCKYFDSSQKLIAGPYKHFVRVLNPQAEFYSFTKGYSLTELLSRKIGPFLTNNANSDNYQDGTAWLRSQAVSACAPSQTSNSIIARTRPGRPGYNDHFLKKWVMVRASP